MPRVHPRCNLNVCNFSDPPRAGLKPSRTLRRAAYLDGRAILECIHPLHREAVVLAPRSWTFMRNLSTTSAKLFFRVQHRLNTSCTVHQILTGPLKMQRIPPVPDNFERGHCIACNIQNFHASSILSCLIRPRKQGDRRGIFHLATPLQSLTFSIMCETCNALTEISPSTSHSISRSFHSGSSVLL